MCNSPNRHEALSQHGYGRSTEAPQKPIKHFIRRTDLGRDSVATLAGPCIYLSHPIEAQIICIELDASYHVLVTYKLRLPDLSPEIYQGYRIRYDDAAFPKAGWCLAMKRSGAGRSASPNLNFSQFAHVKFLAEAFGSCARYPNHYVSTIR